MAAKRKAARAVKLSSARLAEMIEEATVDAYGDEEQATGWHATLETQVELPFETEVLGIPVKVVGLDIVGYHIVAVCVRGKERQRIDLAELPLPTRPPEGAEWIEAYRQWARQQS